VGEPSANATVLIVDDDPVSRMMLKTLLLKILRVRVIEADDGLDGITKAREERPDLLFLDVNTPVQDGLETLRELQADPALSQMPVIVLSGTTNSDKAMQMVELGVLDRIAKPIGFGIVRRLGKLVESLGSPMRGLTYK